MKRVINKRKTKRNREMKKELFKTSLLSITALFCLMLSLGSCANEEVVQKTADSNGGKNLTIFTTGAEPKARTSLDYNTGNFYWEAGDYIYVLDEDNIWQKSGNTPTAKVASFKFYVPGKFLTSKAYKVYYPGKNGNQNQVTIPTAQTQIAPDSLGHLGISGDCGTATASWSATRNGFFFQLDHQATYLVFQPYTSNAILQKCYLTKVEVSSDNDIASTYVLDPTNGLMGTGTGKQIVLTTKGSGRNVNGFPLNTASASVTTNGAYMVIKPGMHTLKVRYWIKDVVTNIEGTITKILNPFFYAKNTYYDMKADLDVRSYDGDHYYMWDAQKQYWDGHEWNSANHDQPTLVSQANPNYPKSNSDNRYYNEVCPGWGLQYDAQQSLFTTLPNANEMAWYVMNGDPRWDADELWTTMGHLYKGGIWLKKKAYISGIRNDLAPDGVTDLRLTPQTFSKAPLHTLPDVSSAGNYFYMPALGSYLSGRLYGVGSFGYYWSSSGGGWDSHFFASYIPWEGGDAFFLFFSDNNVLVDWYGIRHNGFRVQAFE